MSSKHALQLISGLKRAEDSLKAGQVDSAHQILSKLSQRYPQAEPVWQMLASVCGQRSDYQGVIASAKRLIGINPRNPYARNFLGSAYAALGKSDQAIEQLTQALVIDPHNPAILNNLGNALYAVGDYEQAKTRFKQALQVNNAYPEAHFGLGSCYLAEGLWSESLVSYQHAHRFMADNYLVNFNLGMAYRNLGELDKASESFQRAVALTDKPALALCALAKTKQLQGRLDEALDYIDQSLRSMPDNIDARAERAEILYKCGRMDDAHDVVCSLVTAGQVTVQVVEVYGLLCHRFNECDTVVSLAESLLQKDDLIKSSRVSLHYLLGSLYDRLGEFGAAFGHYERANTILPNQFDRREFREDIDCLIAGYAAERIAQLPSSGCQDPRPVFIVGMPRSGTSLVEQILASHPDVYGAGERNDINELAGKLCTSRQFDYAKHLDAIDRNVLTTLADRYITAVFAQAGDARRITDKMPANVFHLGLIQQLFPQARILHCRRDPRDTCLSIYFQQFSRGLTFANDLEDCAFYYREYERIMAHWGKVLSIPILAIDYERLVGDLEECARGMVEFLGLEWNARCLNFHGSDRVTATASFDQVRSPIYSRSMGRWRHYQEHIGALRAEFGAEDEPQKCLRLQAHEG